MDSDTVFGLGFLGLMIYFSVHLWGAAIPNQMAETRLMLENKRDENTLICQATCKDKGFTDYELYRYDHCYCRSEKRKTILVNLND